MEGTTETVIGVPERLQPTMKEIHEHYRALPKRKYGATGDCPTACLITNVIEQMHPQLVDLGDIEVRPSSRADVVPPTVAFWVGTQRSPKPARQELEPELNRLALHFDSCAQRRLRHKLVRLSAGTCVRIIERFARSEGIDLG